MVDALKLSKKVKNLTMTVCIADFRYNRSCQLPINLLILGFRNHLFFVSPAIQSQRLCIWTLDYNRMLLFRFRISSFSLV